MGRQGFARFVLLCRNSEVEDSIRETWRYKYRVGMHSGHFAETEPESGLRSRDAVGVAARIVKFQDIGQILGAGPIGMRQRGRHSECGACAKQRQLS
jgi:hypothetical protein